MNHPGNSGGGKKNETPHAPPIVVAVSGASGGCYAVRLIQALLQAGRRVELTATTEGLRMLQRETGLVCRGDSSAQQPHLAGLWPAGDGAAGDGATAGMIRWHPCDRLNASIASGSRPTGGMVICPASLNTIGALASGLAGNLLQRAAQVTLKERRKLIVVLRETPLATLHLEKLVDLSRSGAVILPASPGFYHQPQTIDDLVDYVVARILDQLRIPHDIGVDWTAGDDARHAAKPAE